MNDQGLAADSNNSSVSTDRSEAILMSSFPRSNKTFAEFFAGIGLMRMGLEVEGWSVAFANDIDEQKKLMYETHFGIDKDRFLLGDVHELSVKSIPTVTLATASFPCNDLSLAGARNGLSGQHSSAFWGFVNLLSAMNERKPPLILIENVPGFLSLHGGADFRKAMRALNQLGYDVDPFIIDAALFVPQSRKRLFVVGTLRYDRAQKCTPHLFANSELRPPNLTDFVLSNSDIYWSIRDLPSPFTKRLSLTDIIEPLSESASEWWSRERAEYLLSQMSPKHRSTADAMISKETWSYGTVFRRVRNSKSMAELRVDGLAGCLRTPRGGSGRQILFKAGKDQYFVRLLTPRECARLMGADNYKIESTQNQALFGFGDAVCVPVISWIVRNYLNPVLEERDLGNSQSTDAKKEAAFA